VSKFQFFLIQKRETNLFKESTFPYSLVKSNLFNCDYLQKQEKKEEGRRG
jgi:hypothetical protein